MRLGLVALPRSNSYMTALLAKLGNIRDEVTLTAITTSNNGYLHAFTDYSKLQLLIGTC